MLKLYFFFIIFIIASGHPTFAQNQSIGINSSLAFYSKSFLGLQNDLRSPDKGTARFNVKYAMCEVQRTSCNWQGKRFIM